MRGLLTEWKIKLSYKSFFEFLVILKVLTGKMNPETKLKRIQ